MESEHTTGGIIYGLSLAAICQFFGVWIMLLAIALIVMCLLTHEAFRSRKRRLTSRLDRNR
jgi:hypothetical protein